MHQGNGAEIYTKKIKHVLLKRQKMLLANCCCKKHYFTEIIIIMYYVMGHEIMRSCLGEYWIKDWIVNFSFFSFIQMWYQFSVVSHSNKTNLELISVKYNSYNVSLHLLLNVKTQNCQLSWQFWV